MTDALVEHKGAADEAFVQIAQIPRISIQVFCESPAIVQVVEQAAADRRMAKAQVKVNMGGVAAAIEAFRSAPTPNLIVVESTSERGELMANLDMLAEFCNSGTKVLVIGHENDIALYRALISRGVSDYVVAPFSILEFIQHVSHLYTASVGATLGRLIAVMGAKGGVGASTVAHNLAWSISTSLETQTVIADLDLAFGTAGLDFNQDPPQGVAEAVFSPERVDANLVDRLLSKCGENLHLLAAPATMDRPYDLQELALEPVFDVLRATTPCTVLDIPHQWTSWVRHALTSADELVLVANPDLANLRNARAILEMMRATRPNDRMPKIVLNNIGAPRRPEIAVAEFAKAIELEPLAAFPFDAKLFGTAANNGQMVAELDPSSKIVEAFEQIARRVMGRPEAQRPKKALLGPLLERVGRRKAG